jgi:hypothetical protein
VDGAGAPLLQSAGVTTATLVRNSARKLLEILHKAALRVAAARAAPSVLSGGARDCQPASAHAQRVAQPSMRALHESNRSRERDLPVRRSEYSRGSIRELPKAGAL